MPGRLPRACRRAAACAWAVLALAAAGCAPAEPDAEPPPPPPPAAEQPVLAPRGPEIPVVRMTNRALFLEEPGVMVVRTDAAWRVLWRRYSYEKRVPERDFDTDFSREMVAVVSMGTYVNCDDLAFFVQRVERTADTLFVAVHHEVDRRPVPCDFQSAPVDLVRLPRSERTVRFVPHRAGFVVPGPGRWLESGGGG